MADKTAPGAGKLLARIAKLEAEHHQMKADIREAKDRHDIYRVVCTYARALDRRDWTLMRSAFHPGAIDNHGNFVGDIDDYLVWVKRLYKGAYVSTSHNITSHLCEIDGDGAHTESYALTCGFNGETVNVGSCRYIDRLERRKGKWKIVLRRTYMDWRGEMPAAKPRGAYPMGTTDRKDFSYMRPLKLTPSLQKLYASGKGIPEDLTK